MHLVILAKMHFVCVCLDTEVIKKQILEEKTADNKINNVWSALWIHVLT